MKRKIKKSPYATLSADNIKAPNKQKRDVYADKLEGGDLRVKGGTSNGKR